MNPTPNRQRTMPKPTVQEILARANLKASQNGLYYPRSAPARTTAGHVVPDALFTNPANDNIVVRQQLANREQMDKGTEGKSAYLDTRVFYSAELVQSGALGHVEMPTCFANMNQAMQYRNLQTRSHSTDTTLPRSPEEERKLVHVLFQAFKSVALAEDNEKFLEAFKNEEHDNYFVEIACWDLLRNLKLRSQLTGPLQSRFWTSHGRFEVFEYASFAERFDSVVYILARNKTVCKALLDPPRMYKLVDDPHALKNKTDGNRVINSHKAETMRKGRDAEKGTKSEPTKKRRAHESDDETEEIDIAQQTPLERALTTPLKQAPKRQRTTIEEDVND